MTELGIAAVIVLIEVPVALCAVFVRLLLRAGRRK